MRIYAFRRGALFIMRKFLFYMPCWLFFSLVALIFLVALSACGGDETPPPPTFTPEQKEYRKCLIEHTRLDRRDENLDRAAEICRGR